MDRDALVQTIISEVLARLAETTTAPLPSLPCVLVIAERSQALMALLNARIGKGYHYIFSAENHISIELVHAERIIIPFLSCFDMADLATGRGSSEPLTSILRLLLAGKKVEVMEFEHHTACNTAPAALYDLYASHAKNLESFGLVPVKPVPSANMCYYESLVTAHVVEKASQAENKHLLVRPSAVVTPSAQDMAHRLGIDIQKTL